MTMNGNEAQLEVYMHKASDGTGTTTNITASGMLDLRAPNRPDHQLEMSSTPRL